METQHDRITSDPLATPTLAALYASQGHPDMAEAIYAQLGRRMTGGPLLGPGQAPHSSPAIDRSFLQRLVSLREAVRQVRETGYPDRKAGR